MAITSQIDQLLELKKLYERGILTKEEMEIEKHKILETNNSSQQNSERQAMHPSSDELDRLYQVAHRAKDSDNYEEAAKYYGMIYQNDPNSWEACFYSLYYSTMDKDITDFAYEASKINKNTQIVPSGARPRSKVFAAVAGSQCDAQQFMGKFVDTFTNPLCLLLSRHGTMIQIIRKLFLVYTSHLLHTCQ